jgi:hypothetical protein
VIEEAGLRQQLLSIAEQYDAAAASLEQELAFSERRFPCDK